LVASAVFAGGPLVLFDASTRQPYFYPPGDVGVFTDLGPNGPLTNDESDTLVHNAFAEWSGVVTSYFSGVVTLANVDSLIGPFNGGGIHVIYDNDGSIISGFFGAPPGVAGIASPEYADTASPELLESWAVFNGSLIDPGDTSPFPGATYGGVYTHEIGHAINLAHTQTNGAVVFFSDDLGPFGCPALGGAPSISATETMYPFIDPTPGSTGLAQATVTHPDDIVALSNINPAPGWPASAGTITGRILMPDSTTEVTGVNVIARNLADPLGDCVSALSGDYTQGDLGPDGLFTLNGLTPGADYVLYIDAIVDGGYSTTPTNILFFEEYWNGADESGNVDTDTTCSYVPITAVAGSPVTADILLNVDPSAIVLGDDDAVKVGLPFSFPFCGTDYDSVWVGSNGYVTFGVGDTNPGASVTALLVGAPRICGWWGDLDPATGGVVSAKELGGDFVVTYTQVPEFFFAGLNTFSIRLRADGTHQVSYGNLLTLITTLAGRSPGGGASDPGATDLSAAAQPLGNGVDTVYETFGLGTTDLPGLDLEYARCGTVVGIEDPGVIPASFALLQSRPNPFRSSTTISFDLPEVSPVRLRIFDITGRLIKTMVDEEREAGRHALPWRGDDDLGRSVVPGIYFYRLETPSFEASGKTLRVR
jgi:hypothetical protein